HCTGGGARRTVARGGPDGRPRGHHGVGRGDDAEVRRLAGDAARRHRGRGLAGRRDPVRPRPRTVPVRCGAVGAGGCGDHGGVAPYGRSGADCGPAPRKAGAMTGLRIAPEIQEALAAGRPVVALETTIVTHGMPYPENVATARSLEQEVRAKGATPATIAVIGGIIRVGLTAGELEWLGSARDILKLSRNDLPY